MNTVTLELDPVNIPRVGRARYIIVLNGQHIGHVAEHYGTWTFHINLGNGRHADGEHTAAAALSRAVVRALVDAGILEPHT